MVDIGSMTVGSAVVLREEVIPDRVMFATRGADAGVATKHWEDADKIGGKIFIPLVVE